MTIRDRFRRALRKSTSPGIITHTDTTYTTDSNNSDASDASELSFFSPRRQSFLRRAFTFGRQSNRSTGAVSNNSEPRENDGPVGPDLTLTRTASEVEREIKAEKKRQRKAKYKNTSTSMMEHPSLRTPTKQNMKYQTMLEAWSWERSMEAPRPHSAMSGVSPCCTRPASVYDMDDDYFDYGGPYKTNNKAVEE